MTSRRIVFVFDYPNIATTWSKFRGHEVLGNDIDWIELKRFLKNHAVHYYGSNIQTEFRIFKNRWSSSKDKAKAKWLRENGYTIYFKSKDHSSNSDIDNDIVEYVEAQSKHANIYAVYLIGNDFKNHIPLTFMLDNLCIDSWLGYLNVGITTGTALTNLPEYARQIDLLSETTGIFLHMDDDYSPEISRPKRIAKKSIYGSKTKRDSRERSNKRRDLQKRYIASLEDDKLE